MKNTTVVRRLKSLLARMVDNDFSTKSEDDALAQVISSLTASPPPAKLSKRDGLRCAKCDSDELRYCEDEIITRNLDRIDENGKLLIDGYFDCEGDGTNPRLLCVSCGSFSSLPKRLEYDFQ